MLIRFLLLLILAMVLARVVRGVLASAIAASREQPRRAVGPDRGVKMVRDPVCGTFVVPANALTSVERGEVHHFCSEACRDKYARSRKGRR